MNDFGVFLSVVIPTYNRKKLVYHTVMNLMTVPYEDFEVVVLDDASTDGTAEFLRSKIKDERLRVVVNETNKGGFVNFVASLFEGRGKYILHCCDRDSILPEAIPKLYNELKREEFAAFRGGDDRFPQDGSLEIFGKGFDGLIHDPLARHPSGLIFNGNLLREKFHVEDYTKYADSVFPERFLTRALCCEGKTALYHEALYHNGSGYLMKNRIISGVNSEGTEEDFYFHPYRSWYLFEKTFHQVFGELPIEFTEEQERQYGIHIFDFIMGRLPDYKRFRSQRGNWMHYKLRPRIVTLVEVLKYFVIYLRRMDTILADDKFKNLRKLFHKRIPRYFFSVIKQCLIVDVEIGKFILKGVND